jgi:membrane carboxypeptidase/penicillin-binding protein
MEPLPRFVPRSRSGWLALPLLVAAAWLWGVASTAWTDAPALVSRRLAADRDVLHVEDLPPGGLAVLLRREDPRFFGHGGLDADHDTTITLSVAADLWPQAAGLELAMRAWILDKRIDKDTQLVLFLNRVPVGDDLAAVRGLDEAARRFFGKSCRELDPDEFEVLLTLIGSASGTALYRPA